MQKVQSFDETRGKVIKCKAAVAWEAKKPLDVTEIEVQPPKRGELRVKVVANALCHTDIFTLDGHDPTGIFPSILGHEATAIVESVGEGITTVVPGDIIIPCYVSNCQEWDCIFCQSERNNLCPKLVNGGKGLMPDGTSRFSKDGKQIFHYMNTSTFSEYTVITEFTCAKINRNANLYKSCLLGCGVSTGWGAVENAAKVSPGSTVVVFGLGAVGLAVVQAAKWRGARQIIGIDINPKKFPKATELGCTECYNPLELKDQSIKDFLLSKYKWGYDFTFDCTGNVKVMRDALELSHKGFGSSCIIGVAAAGQEIQTRSLQLVTGRSWIGTAFGGWKGRLEVPELVNRVVRGETTLDPFVTHEIDGLENVNKSIEYLHAGDCLRAVIKISEAPKVDTQQTINVYNCQRMFNGWLRKVKHWSSANNCTMSFSIFIPDKNKRVDPNPPVLFYLAGLECNHETGLKSEFARFASKAGLCVVLPDTSARGVNVEGQDDSWDFGSAAGFYVDATVDKWTKHYNNYTYITKELPEVIANNFAVDMTRRSITGHSMGGHGALSLFLKNPGMYKSVSAFAPIANPTNCPWGQKAFNGYLGSVDAGKQYDSTELMKTYSGPESQILIDVGLNDKFLYTELKVDAFYAACKQRNYPINLRYHEFYDHLYGFVSTFIEDHIAHHAKALGL